MTVPLLTERDVAARLHVGKSTVRRWRTAGKLPFIRFGSIVRYRLTDIETFERESEVQPYPVGIPRKRRRA